MQKLSKAKAHKTKTYEINKKKNKENLKSALAYVSSSSF